MSVKIPKNEVRLHSLDYLRGLAALSIVFFHYSSWTFGAFDASSLIGRVGLYGVSIFYVLSGLTLYHVYHAKMGPTVSDVLGFARKRAFRIFPLLWLVTLLAVIAFGKSTDWERLFLNLSGLFGFVAWDGAIATGAWSIGNELVFYVFFPFFVLFAKKLQWAFIVLSAIIVGIFLWFALVGFDRSSTLESQWGQYVHPLNQIFLFWVGYIMGLWDKRKVLPAWVPLSALVIGAVVFMILPAHGDRIALVTGWPRLALTACCILVCWGAYKLPIRSSNFAHWPLSRLGEASYSVYLLHPLVYNATGLINQKFLGYPESMRVLASVLLTLIFSYLTFVYFEKFFMRLGKKPLRIASA